MSTNYFAKIPGETGEGLHIGQHAGSAEFLFRAHPDLGLTVCDGWRTYLERPDVTVWSEHGYEVPLDEIWAVWTRRPADVGGPHRMRARWRGHREGTQWRDIHGHPFDARDFC